MKTLKFLFGIILLSLVLACTLPSVTALPGVAKAGKKKYTCLIKVKNPPEGTRENPGSAYTAFTSKLYYYGRYMGKYKIQLLDYKDGKEANNYIRRWSYNVIPKSNEEYIYLRFRIKFISAAKNEKVYVSNLINMSSGLFDRTGTKQVRHGLVGICPGEKSLIDATIKPGDSLTCYYAARIPAGNTPVTYRLETGYDSAKHESKYTWFTTKR